MKCELKVTAACVLVSRAHAELSMVTTGHCWASDGRQLRLGQMGRRLSQRRSAQIWRSVLSSLTCWTLDEKEGSEKF